MFGQEALSSVFASQPSANLPARHLDMPAGKWREEWAHFGANGGKSALNMSSTAIDSRPARFTSECLRAIFGNTVFTVRCSCPLVLLAVE